MSTISSKQRPWDCLDINIISAVMLTVHERYCGDNWGEGWKDDKWEVMAQDFRPHYEECFPLHVAVMRSDPQSVEHILTSSTKPVGKDCLDASAFDLIPWNKPDANLIAEMLLDRGFGSDRPCAAGKRFIQSYQRSKGLRAIAGLAEESEQQRSFM